MSYADAVWRRVRLKIDRWTAFAVLLPSIILTFVFVYGFIGWNTLISFSRWKGLVPNYALRGLKNYILLFQNQRFQIDMYNMTVYSVIFIVGCIFIGLLLAILLDQNVHGENFFRVVFLLPMAISLVVTGIFWAWLLTPGTPETGSLGLNQLFDIMGLGFLKSRWHTNPKFGIISVAIAAVWQMSGYVMAMYLAAIRGIPAEAREAAMMDGASTFQIYMRVIIPMLTNITLSVIIILAHIAMRVFDLVMAMTGPGLGFCTDVPAYFMWETTFQGNRYNQGAAIATILLLLVTLFVVPYLIHSHRQGYEGE